MSHVIIAVQGQSFTPQFLNCLLDTFEAVIRAKHTFSYMVRDSILTYDNFMDAVTSDIEYDYVIFIDSHSIWNPEWIVDLINNSEPNLTFGSRNVFMNTDIFDIQDSNTDANYPLTTKTLEESVILGSISILKLSRETVKNIIDVPYTGNYFSVELSKIVNISCDFSKLVIKV